MHRLITQPQEQQFCLNLSILYKFIIVFLRADQSHRIPSYQPDQLIEKQLHKKQCRTQYNAPSSIRIHILLSVLPIILHLHNQIGHVKNNENNMNQNEFKFFDKLARRP